MTNPKVWLVLIMLWVVIGSTYIGIKISIHTIPPFLMSGSRYTLSGGLLIMLYLLVPAKRNFIKANLNQEVKTGNKSRLVPLFSKKQWMEASIIGGALILGGQGLLTWGSNTFRLALLLCYFLLFLFGYCYLENYYSKKNSRNLL